MELKIDPEFKSLIPPLVSEELLCLENNIKKEGCRDPLVIWNGIILDGHNRYDICTRNNWTYDIHTVDLPDREAAMDWIDRNQIGRRNLSKDDFRLIVGRIYNRDKKRHGGDRKSSVQKEHLKSTAETIAKDFDISSSSARRHGKFAEAVETVKKEKPEVAKRGRQALFRTANDRLKEQAETRKSQRKKKAQVVEEKPSVEKPEKETPASAPTPTGESKLKRPLFAYLDEKPGYAIAMKYARMAVADLRDIQDHHHDRDEAFEYVLDWIEKRKATIREN